MAAILRQQAIRHLSASGRRNFSSSTRQRLAAARATGFCPLYSLGKSPSAGCVQHHLVLRHANTSSGFFAPTTILSGQRVARATSGEPRGNTSVFEHSDHLPSLPVPNLNDTLEKLKQSVSPVAMNSAEFVQTLQLIDEFSESAGPKLDMILRMKANRTKNWLSHDWWKEHTYLKSRQPLVINSNPAMMYPEFPFEVRNQRSLVSVTAQLVSGLIDFKLALVHGYNPEATSADNETRLDPNTCYHQYQSIFGLTRIPGEHIDELKFSSWNRESSAEGESADRPFSLVVSFRGRFFEVQLRNVEDEKDRVEKLEGILNKILTSVDQRSGGDDAAGAGVLTASNRNDWARGYKLLDSDSMDAIQQAQFLVCLDTIAPEIEPESVPKALLNSPSGGEEYMAALGRQILHADTANVGNRWFDKSIQLIVVANEGADRFLGAGINYEHSFGEGTLIARMIEHSFDKTVQGHNSAVCANASNFFARQQVAASEPATFRQLPMFDRSTDMSRHLDRARLDFGSLIGQFDMSYFRYRQYGSNAIKSWHFSPDSWFQVALQWAYHDVHKRLGPCYESASTRQFAYGRTETIRSLTQQVAQFCIEPKYETMLTAIQSHKNSAISAVNGNAIDRALMGYRLTFHELKTNNWRWGLPTLEGDSGDSKEILDSIELSESGHQNVDIRDLFTGDELQTIGSFFNNELIKRSSKFALSTSQVRSDHPNICMTYGPILADGYGCCYNITGQQIVALITANSSNQSFSCEVEKLNESLHDSLNRMRDIVEEQRSKSHN